MAEPLKNSLNKKYLLNLGRDLSLAKAKIDPHSFSKKTMGNDWNSLELKQRMSRICLSLGEHLPPQYPSALRILLKVAPQYGGFEAMFFPEFVATFGRDQKHLDRSRQALTELTQYSSSEFAIRPFIEDAPTDMMDWMRQLASHDNYHIRRLASEGCRPLLPWASQLVFLRQDPKPIFPILDRLKEDPELYVRKSVANNINDISKDHPQQALKLCKAWLKSKPHPHTQWIVNHGLRTLIKDGNKQALSLLGFGDSVKVSQFKISSQDLRLGEDLRVQIQLSNTSSKEQNVMFDYIIYHQKKSGELSPKVFKGKRLVLAPKQQVKIEKKHKLQKINTRQYYAGRHEIQWQVNGEMGQKRSFNLRLK